MNKRIIAIDPGMRKCGIAISDETATIARPLKTVQRKELFKWLKKYIEEFEIKLILVGQAYTAEGPYLPTAKLASRIKRNFKIDTLLINEDFSTRKALQLKSKKHSDDELAAAIILQGYLNDK